jgi:peptide/nickel transport system substrate-binding protein
MEAVAMSRGVLTRRRLLQAGLGGAAAISLSSLLAGCQSAASVAGPPPRPRRGGRLRTGWAGGGQSESLNPLSPLPTIDFIRSVAIFEPLTNFGPPGGPDVSYRLAAAMTPNADYTTWRVALREGVTWHDGKPFTARDVLFSISTVLDPNQGTQWLNTLRMLDLKASRAIGDTQVDLVCSKPTLDLPLRFASMPVIQDGTSDFSTVAIGTGAFKLASFRPGEGTLLLRNASWWDRSGGPYLDEVELRSVPDNTARVNALLGGDLDLISDLTYTQYASLSRNRSFRTVRIPAGNIPLFKMRVDKPPFDDLRVRQAFKLMVDRRAMLERVFVGFGTIGNDAFGAGLPDYDTTLATPAHDPAQARRLLRQAGKDGLSVTLHTTDGFPGLFESASLFVQQAREAGVTVTLDKVAADQYYNPSERYIGWEFASAIYNQNNPFISLVPGIYEQNATFNETGWLRPQFDAAFEQAVATPDRSLRKRLLDQLQQELHDQGGHILFVVGDAVLVTSPRVQNVKGVALYRNEGEGDFSQVFLS